MAGFVRRRRVKMAWARRCEQERTWGRKHAAQLPAPLCHRGTARPNSLSFDAHMADASDDVVGGIFASFHRDNFDWIGWVVGTKHQVAAGALHVFDGAA